MTQDNLSAVLYGIDDLRLEQRPIPVPKDDEVLIKMEAIGICGSDVHYLKKGRICDFIVDKPMILGHESSGMVVGVGKNVKHLKEGDRVAIEPGVPCGQCNFCKGGRYNLCPEIFFCATPPDDGNLSRYYCHSASYCYKLPDNMSYEEGALMEPLSVGVHACRRGNVGVGSVVLVLGAGPIGLVTLLSAKAFGASKVLITDILDERLQVAKSLGADHTLKIEKHMTEQDIIKKITELLGEDPTVSLDCSGAEVSVRVALQVTKTGGVAVLVGMGKSEITIPLSGALFREIDIRGCFRYHNTYPTAIELVSSGKINVKPLVTHKFKIEDTQKAFDTAVSGEGNPIKIVIYPNRSNV
ncbi:hypothetical protein WA026_014372 [Henosepilachna vigintioctopunctata]|uniref:Sorbitol dehydrogenase n=1 Tax=Henosepilachna vigintioctopunctata TaxID=420089 RepID=A0AAW1ULY3_9CUCU